MSATQDTVDDDGESVKLSFGNLPTGVAAGTTDETTVSITDDDVPSVTVSFGSATYTAAEGDTVRVKVKLSADPERTVEVPITVTNVDGASSADYSGVPANVVFDSGDTEKTFDFEAIQDTVDDDGERVRLTFGTLPPRVSSTSPSQAVVSITDDDVPSVSVSFEQASYTVAEGNSVTVKVKLSADPERTVTIPLLRVNQGGASSADYSGVPADVEFDSGDTEKTFTFAAASDSDNDDGESVRVSFGTLPEQVSAGTHRGTTVSITDDDVPSVTVSFEQASYTVAEGNSVIVKVILSADPERTVTIPITKTNQDGASNGDYSVPATVVFNSGDIEKTFDFSATQDTVDDDGESVKLGFRNLPTGVAAGTTDETTVSITDDDVPSVTVRFEQASYTVAEGNSVTVKVKLSADPERTVTIPITKANQGGVSSSDYSGVPGNVVFNSGDTEKTFSFSATQDTVNDDGESVKLGFGNLPTGVSSGTTDETTVSITDDDVPSVTVSFGSATHSVIEGESATVTVTLSADPERTVTIPITRTNQDDASDSDYSGVPSSVVFNSGDTEKTFDFEATDDEEDDNDESVKLTFGTLPTGVTEGTTNQTVLSIIDNDGGRQGSNKGLPEGVEITVNFEQVFYTVAEGNSVSVKVTLDQDPGGTVTIPITKTDQGGASSADYSGVPASIEFVSGDTEKTFSFAATQDTADDDGESVRVGFGDLPDGVTAGTTSASTILITDDDGTPPDQVSVQVSFQASAYALTEGGTTAVTVTLSADPERTVSIPLTTTNGTGTTSGDYSGVPASVDFASGETRKSFTFTAERDDDDEDAEELTLGFDTLPDGVSGGTFVQAVVTIIDSIHVSFGASYYQAYEGGDGAVVTVQLDNAPDVETVIPITATGMDGATSADWTGVPSNVTFASGDTEKTFTVMAYDDQVEDDGESVELGFGTLPAGVAKGTPSVATVELMNMEVPTCADAVWCATVEFANTASQDWERMGLGLGYHTTQEPYLRYSSLSDNRFTFRGKEYQVWSMLTTPGTHPSVGPGSPGRIPEYSTFAIRVMEVVGGKLENRVDRDHQRDWTFYIDGIALPFTENLNGSANSVIWQHPDLQDLYASWTDGDTYEVMIVEDPVDSRPAPPVTIPMSPDYLRVIPGDGVLTTIWRIPYRDGNSDITHYRLQWKLGTESWGNPNAIEEATVQPPGRRDAPRSST